MLFNIFDRMTIRVLRVGDRWQAFHVSNDGKKDLYKICIFPRQQRHPKLFQFWMTVIMN